MEFTYNAYKNMLQTLREHDYEFANYQNYKQWDKSVILRHDIDYYLKYAEPFAEIEHEYEARAVYFVETSSEFYNLFSRQNMKLLHKIISLGHIIGLHFDRKKYGQDFNVNSQDYLEKIYEEIHILEYAIGQPIACISMHEPCANELEYDLQLPDIANAYSKEFFEGFKYFSDSIMNWREDVLNGIKSDQYPRLQILTHPFWYAEKEYDIRTMLLRFINTGTEWRYRNVKKICGYFDEYVDKSMMGRSTL